MDYLMLLIIVIAVLVSVMLRNTLRMYLIEDKLSLINDRLRKVEMERLK